MKSPRETKSFGLDEYGLRNYWLPAVKTTGDAPPKKWGLERPFTTKDYLFSEKDLDLMISSLREKQARGRRVKLANQILDMATETKDKIAEIRNKSRMTGGEKIEIERVIYPSNTVTVEDVHYDPYDNKGVDSRIGDVEDNFVGGVDKCLREEDKKGNYQLFEKLDQNHKKIDLRTTVDMMVELAA